ncbi:MAG: hypothetical protein ACYS0D_09925 [Planctomycetota bacterium]|jgi:hypothetical protein
MKTRLLTLCALAVAGCVLTASGPVGRVNESAQGEGSIRFGDGEHGRGYFLFEVEAGQTGDEGRFFFAAEDHHEYPDVVIRIQSILRVDVGGRVARIKAQGHLQFIPVVIEAVAVDNVGTGNPDEFSVETTPLHGDDDGDGHFHASGKLFRGDIQVGALE